MVANITLPSTVRGVVRSTSERLADPLAGVGRIERILWAVALAGMVVDLAATYHGLQLGYTETNPIARVAIQSVGYGGLVGLKLFTLAFAGCCRLRIPRDKSFLVPTAIAIPWTFAAVITSMTVFFGPL